MACQLFLWNPLNLEELPNNLIYMQYLPKKVIYLFNKLNTVYAIYFASLIFRESGECLNSDRGESKSLIFRRQK